MKKDKQPLVSIVIPVRKVNDYVGQHIPHHLAMDYKNIEIIIVSEAVETATFPKTKFVKVGRVNPATKRNAGVKAAKGEIVAFIDDDAYPVKHWLSEAVPFFENPSICAVAGPQLIPPNSTFIQQVSGLVYSLGAGKQKYVYAKEKQQYIDDYPTCNLIVRKSDFQKIKGFNETYWGGEDTKLCYDLTQKLKQKMIYDPRIIVFHHRRKKIIHHLKQSLMWSIYRGFFSRKFPETSLRLVYFIPPLFLLFVIVGGIASLYSPFIRTGYFTVLLVYLLYSMSVAARSKSIKLFFPLLFLLIATHLTYGFGVLRGLVMAKSLDKTFHPSENLTIK